MAVAAKLGRVAHGPSARRLDGLRLVRPLLAARIAIPGPACRASTRCGPPAGVCLGTIGLGASLPVLLPTTTSQPCHELPHECAAPSGRHKHISEHIRRA